MHTIELPAGPLKYRTWGPRSSTAHPVVFLHPVLTDGRLWTNVGELLAARGVRSYAPDWPLGAHVAPLHPDADRSPEGVAQMVRDFLDRLDLTDVCLVGNDTGGALTQFVITGGEPRVSSALLINCDAFTTFPPFPLNAILAALRVERLAVLVATAMRWTPLRHSWLGYGLLSRHLDPSLTRDWLRPARTDPAVRRDLIAFLRAVDPERLDDATHRLADVDIPIEVLWGMADRCFRPALGRRLARAVGTDLREVPGARTLLALDAPEEVAEAITALRPVV